MKAKLCGALCEKCPLKAEEWTFVPPEANEGAKFAVVGNYPTVHEAQEKRPFMGTDGGTLTRYFQNEGLHRGNIHWTTVVLCRPPEDDMDRFLTTIKRRNKKRVKENRELAKQGLDIQPLIPTPHECCAPRLQAELKKFDHVVTCGSAAAKAVIHKSATVMALRGGPTEIQRGERLVKILPTFHPSFVSKARRWTGVFKQDIHRAVKWFKTGRLHWEPPKILWHPSPDKLREFLQSNVAYWTYDVETNGIECLTANLRCISIGTPKAAVVIGWMGIDGRTQFYLPEEKRKVKQVLKEFFEDSTKVIASWNGGYYDKLVMRNQLGIEVNGNLDGMLIHRLVESELPHSLGFVGSVYTEAPSWKTDREGRKKAYGSETDQELHEYCAYDVAITAAVIPPLIEKVKIKGQDKLIQHDHKLQKICSDMHSVGMYVDQVKRLEFEQKYLRDVSERRVRIRDICGIDNFNPASVLQMRDLLFNKWRLDPPLDEKDRLTKNGDPSTSDHVMRALLSIRTLDPEQRALIKEVRHYRRSQKLLGTYCTKLRYNTEDAWGGWDESDEWMEKEWREKYGIKKLGIVDPVTNRMHPGYNCHGTLSGRLSSSRPINAQNFPGFLRSMVCAAPGNVLVGADMDQLELRIAASRWKSAKYLEAFEAGHDPHSTVTSLAVFGDRFEKAALECGAGPAPWITGTKFKGAAKKLRGLSKAVAYASQYFATPATVHRIITQTEVENDDGTTTLPYLHMALREVRVMHRNWADGAQYETGWKREIEFWKTHGFIAEPVLGRTRDFLDGENPNELVNFPIQAAASSLMNIAIIELAERIPLWKWGRGTGIINQCHDSIAVECPKSEAEWVATQIEDVMNMIHPSLPGVEFTAKADIAHRWSEV